MEDNRSSCNENSIELEENIVKYLLNYRNVEQQSETDGDGDEDENEEEYDSLMNNMEKDHIPKICDINCKICSDCRQSTLDKDLDNEKLLLEENHNKLNKHKELNDLKYATNDKLLEEIENVLASPTSKAPFLKPRSASSPKLITMTKICDTINSNVDVSNEVNSSEFYNDSLGYYTFKSTSKFTTSETINKSDIASKHGDDLNIINYKNNENTKESDSKYSSNESDSSSPLVISISSEDENILDENEKANCPESNISSMKSAEPLNSLNDNNKFPELEKIIHEMPPLNNFVHIESNPFQVAKNLNKRFQLKEPLGKKRRFTKKQNRKNKRILKQEQQKTFTSINDTSNSFNQIEIQVNLPAEKRVKLNDGGDFFGKNIRNISLIYEKRKSQPLKYKPISFVSGGIAIVGVKSNFEDVTDQLKICQRNTENAAEYQKDIKHLFNNPGGKIMIKMGYIFEKGLGKYAQGKVKYTQGILQPIEAHIRKGRGSIGSYGCEMQLPTSMKIQEKQYRILRSLNKTDLQPIKNESNFKHGIYSNVYFDYSTLQNPLNLQTYNNFECYEYNSSQDFSMNSNYFKEINNNFMKNVTLSSNPSNIFIEFRSFEKNSMITSSINSRKLLKAVRRINVQAKPLQLLVTSTTGCLSFDQILDLKEHLNITVINAALLYNVSLQFESVFVEEGFLKISCTNENTYYWMENLIRNSKLGQFLPNIKLMIQNINSDSTPGYKMEIFVPGKSLKTSECFKLLEIQNPGLITREWRIYKRNEIKNGVQIIIEINENSLNTLKSVYQFRPYLALNRIHFVMIENF